MRKSLFLFSVAFILSLTIRAQFTILGPTFVKSYTPTTTWGSWCDDPLSNSGQIWVMPAYYGQTLVYEYASMANFTNNIIATTYTLPLGYAGTGHVVYGGYLYYNKYNTNNLVKYSLATQSVVLDVPLAGAGSMNTYAYQWGGFSDIDFAVDENGLYVIYSSAGNGGNIVISKLNPNTLTPLATYSTATTKACGNAFMAQGSNYSLANYSAINTSLNYRYNTLTGTGAAASISFTNGNSYLTNLVYNPSTKILFAWNMSGFYTYTLVPTYSIQSSVNTVSACAGNTISITFTANGTYTAPNTYTAELSNAAGNFTAGTSTLGTLTGTTGGVITATIPLGTPTGTAYRVRVNSNSPGVIGEVNLVNITVSSAPSLSIAASAASVCAGSPVTFTASGAATYSWSSGANTSTAAMTPTANATYTVVGSNTLGCSSSVTQSVSVQSGPTMSLAGNYSICPGGASTMTVSGANSYSWNTGANTSTISVTPSVNTTYTVIGTNTVNGCTSSVQQAVTVNPNPTVTITGPTTLCVGETITLTANGASTYTWNTGSNNASVAISPTANASYTVNGTSTQGCNGSTITAIAVSPCTGINEYSLDGVSVRMYPNPATDLVTLAFNSIAHRSLKVYDITGKLIVESDFTAADFEIKIKDLKKGTYIVAVIENDNTSHLKLIKE